MQNHNTGKFPRWKRAFDLVAIVVSAPLWLPLMILISFWIRAVSGGPVIFRQQRVGLCTRPFFCLKFRSMKVDAETKCHEDHFRRLVEADVPMTKLDERGDSRLIFGGKIIRAMGLDELPQIFNVLKGEMSLVGPRPCTPAEFEHYETRQKERVNVPPGLTGFWQVNGKNKTTFSEMVEMDRYYGENMSVSLDLVIVLKTVPALALQAWETRSARGAAASAPAVGAIERKSPSRVVSGFHQVR
jgi:lipopolysaccharide/colanic/teichoic acid biosynthesis glycosyltransferase